MTARMRRTAAAALEVAGAEHVTSSQLAHWRRSGLVRPGRGELTQARAIAALLRAGLSLRHIRGAVERLRLLPGPEPDGAPAGIQAPLRLAVHGQELFVQRADGGWEGDRAPGQLIIDGVVALVPLDGVALGALPGGLPHDGTDPAGLRPRSGPRRGRPDGPAGGSDPAAGGGRAAPAAESDRIRRFLDRQRALERSGP
ncbi:hypothetical protein [Frankia sp. EI5c]|uniref:hypothetical protein n=1 Tax=Frankia sp. EI5c TaxID=683316 RepID=UPI001F5BB66D|nr:hypothetical protein [Frankia sp. EI5c]